VDEMVPDRAGSEPTYAPKVISKTVLPLSNHNSLILSTETGDESRDDTHAQNPSLNDAGKKDMTARNKVAGGLIRRLWDPYFETQREGKPYTKEELACE
jgi:hypothetical protein